MSRLIFRFRYPLHVVLGVLGFWAPWNLLYQVDPRGPNAHVWGILAANLSQLDGTSLFASFNLLLWVAILLALAAAGLRTWGTAYLSSPVVRSPTMHVVQPEDESSGILTDGPFGYVRNPLYLGTFLHTVAIALLMPRSGAIFTLVTIAMLQLWLIHDEEAFLKKALGATYEAYCGLVPRLLPSLWRKAVATGSAPNWGQAFLGEIYFWGVAGSLAAAGWSYNAGLLIRCVIVALGVSILARAIMPRARA